MPVRISDASGNASYSAMAQGLTYAADHGARVANLSYRASASSTVSSAAQYFQSKGGVTTVSAGNQGDFDSSKDNPYVLTVSAESTLKALASWSTTGNNIDLAAPGEGIMSTLRGGVYDYVAGTSFSAPVVAGVAALVLSVNPNLSGAQTQDVLKNSADDFGTPGWDTSFGWGRVNAFKAIQAALNIAPVIVIDQTPPTTTISAPADGSVLKGQAVITASALDNVGVTKVECYVNGQLAATSQATPASFTWDTTTWPDASHLVQTKAYDAAGNMGTSAAITVLVQNASADTVSPVVNITSPADKSVLTLKSTKVSLSASDNTSVKTVELWIDGKLVFTTTAASSTYTWNTSKATRGSHTLQAFAYDGAGNKGASPIITVTK